MAKRFCKDGGIAQSMSRGKDTSRALSFDIPTGDFNPGSEENIANRGAKKRAWAEEGAKKRAWAEEGTAGTNKVDEEFSAEGGHVVTRRPRGRPLGSRNKPKGPLHEIRDIPDTAKCRILEVPSGLNLTDMLESFMGTSDLGLVVTGGRGIVTNVNLNDPVRVGGVVDNRGPFEIISLTGAFPRGVDTRGGTGLKVTLTDAQGNHVGGTVVTLIAYGTVLVTVGIVKNINRDVLDVQHPGLLLSPAAVAAQQHFQSPTMMTVQQQIGIQSPSPTQMPMEHRIGMVPMNNAMWNLPIGSVTPGSLALGSITSNSEEPIINVMSNIGIGSVTPNTHDISRQPER